MSSFRIAFFLCLLAILLLVSCEPGTTPTAQAPIATPTTPPGFVSADGSRPLSFPADFGAHPDFRTEWWYYTGNLQTEEGQHFGFELTIFRVGLLSPTAGLPDDSTWSGRDIYFAHFALSDIANERFYAFQRYARPGPGLAGAQSDPYRVWVGGRSITENGPGVYELRAEQDEITLNLTLTDEMGVVLNGEKGYSRKGQNPTNASYYYSQPRLRADGSVKVSGSNYRVEGLAWNDHEFSTSVLDEDQIGWDWFSLQFEDGAALMLFQLRKKGGGISDSASGTFIAADKASRSLHKSDFDVRVQDQWRSPHTQGLYPSLWEIRLTKPACLLQVKPWMSDQELNFPPMTYWEGAVHFEGSCNDTPVRGNGYIELTGYVGNLPLP